MGVEPVTAMALRSAPTLDVPDLLQLPGDRIAAWQCIEIRTAELVLSLHPGTRLGRVNVLHPAIRVRHLHAMVGIYMIAALCARVGERRRGGGHGHQASRDHPPHSMHFHARTPFLRVCSSDADSAR